MECLNLNAVGNEKTGNEQNALVPYKGDGTLIPYGGFDFIKKRKPRPKVDLDPETERVWKLLMCVQVNRKSGGPIIFFRPEIIAFRV